MTYCLSLPVLRLFVLTVALFVGGPASAQQEPNDTGAATVGVYVHPPFVTKSGDGYGGMAIDLWELAAGRLGVASRYVEYENVGALVDATASGSVDVAVTNMTVTRERAERIDLTHPWFDAGQRVLVRQDGGIGTGDLLRGLNESGHLQTYAGIALVIVIATFLVTLFDRRFDDSFPKRWRDGMAESFYTVMSVATSGKAPARKNLFGWVGRIWQGLWLVCGIAVLAYVTSSVTSVMTTLSLTNQINSVADLPGRVVGVQPGSVSEDYARRAGLNARPFQHIEEAANALAAGAIDAVLGDAPVLEYYAHTNPARGLAVVGPLFAPDKYAFGLTQDSRLTRQLSVEIIGLHESGRLGQIRARYFGEE
jgi:ABC-type amino acid transport substrate-binding protein